MRELAPLLAEDGIIVDADGEIVGEVPDMETLQNAMGPAVERQNLALFTPVGTDRELAAVVLREVTEALNAGHSTRACDVLEAVAPESLKRRLQDRARYLQALTANGPAGVHALAGELVDAHTDTVEWLTTVLAEEAVGGPAPLRATPLQVVRDGVTQVVRFPGRVAADGVNRAGHTVTRAGELARGRMLELLDGLDRTARDAYDVLGTGVDAALDRAEQVARRDSAASTADAVHTVRRERGALDVSELPIREFDRLSVSDAVAAVRTLETAEDLQAVLRYEDKHNNRAGVLTVARSRHADVARTTVS